MTASNRNRPRMARCLACICFVLGLTVCCGSVHAAPSDDAKKEPAKTTYILPKYFKELGLTDQQKARASRIIETYNPEIDDLRKKLEVYSKQPLLSTEILALSLRIKKLSNDRQRLLLEVLTPEQREKYRELSGSK